MHRFYTGHNSVAVLVNSNKIGQLGKNNPLRQYQPLALVVYTDKKPRLHVLGDALGYLAQDSARIQLFNDMILPHQTTYTMLTTADHRQAWLATNYRQRAEAINCSPHPLDWLARIRVDLSDTVIFNTCRALHKRGYNFHLKLRSSPDQELL